MIVKIHNRGVGRGSGATEYLLGRDGMREDATLLRGDPQQVQDLCDSSLFTKKYTSGVLSFEEKDIPEPQKQELMDSFESVIMAGLDKDQYSVLWVEHQDKGRLELNFVIPNVELTTGRRLQPYYDAVDRPLVNAWKECVNYQYQFSDPNDPEKTRFLVTPRDLPQSKQEAAEALNQFVSSGIQAGFIKDRSGIVNALEAQGFTVARQTSSSISIADPDGGRNIRLKGALYEQNFRVGEDPQSEFRDVKRDYQEQRSAEYERNSRSLSERIARKADYHRTRYSRGEITASAQYEKPIPDQNMAVRDYDFAGSYMCRTSDIQRVPETGHQHTAGSSGVLDTAYGESGRNDLLSAGANRVSYLHPRRDGADLRRGRRLHGSEGVLNDRDRAIITERIRAIRQRTSESFAGTARRVSQLNRAGDTFKSSVSQRSEKNRRFNAATQGIPDRIQSLNQSIKRQINQQRVQKPSHGMHF